MTLACIPPPGVGAPLGRAVEQCPPRVSPHVGEMEAVAVNAWGRAGRQNPRFAGLRPRSSPGGDRDALSRAGGCARGGCLRYEPGRDHSASVLSARLRSSSRRGARRLWRALLAGREVEIEIEIEAELQASLASGSRCTPTAARYAMRCFPPPSECITVRGARSARSVADDRNGRRRAARARRTTSDHPTHASADCSVSPARQPRRGVRLDGTGRAV